MNLELTSDRLLLRPLEGNDIDICLEMFTDAEVLKYAHGAQTEAEIRSEMPNWIKRGGDGSIGVWCICDRGNGEKLGTVALLPIPNDENGTDFSLVIPGTMPNGDVEIGYFFKRSAWGRGYATEACGRILQLAFEDSPLAEVVATFEEENFASKNVLKKAGFTDHGTMKSYGEEGPIYRIARDEWLPN